MQCPSNFSTLMIFGPIVAYLLETVAALVAAESPADDRSDATNMRVGQGRARYAEFSRIRTR